MTRFWTFGLCLVTTAACGRTGFNETLGTLHIDGDMAQEGAAVEFPLSLSLDGEIGFPVTIDWQATSGTATAGRDFLDRSGVVVLSEGQRSTVVRVETIADGVHEATESLTVSIVSVTNGDPDSVVVGRGEAVGSIIDADVVEASFGLAASSTGENTNVSIEIQLSSPSEVAFVLPYSLSGAGNTPTDVVDVGNGTLTHTPGAATMSVSLQILDEGAMEDPESLMIELGAPVEPRVSVRSDAQHHTLTIDECFPLEASDRHDAVGGGTEASPFTLCAAAQLASLANEPMDWGATYLLRRDLDLTAHAPLGVIGSEANPFRGRFYGGNHVLSGITIDRPGFDAVGLFGVVASPHAHIRDLTLHSPDVTGDTWTGAMIGVLRDGRATNLRVEGGVVSGGANVGGVIGSIERGEASYLYAQGAVSGGSEVGGIVGDILRGYLRHCAAQVTVVASGSIAGAAIGSTSAAVVRDCFATGTATSAGHAGGLAGTGTYSHFEGGFADVDVQGDGRVGPIVGHDAVGFGVALERIYFNDDRSCVNASGACYVHGTGIDVSADPDYFFEPSNPPLDQWDFSRDWLAITGSFPTPRPVPLAPDWGTCSDHLSDAPFAGGAGSVYNPYLICTPAQLATIGQMPSVWDRSFKLMVDIDMAAIGNAVPIGNSTTQWFRGDFDGDGRTIANLAMTLSTSEVGLFGAAHLAAIRNVRLTGVAIEGDTMVGGLVGRLGNFVMVREVCVDGTVMGAGNVGALVGSTNWAPVLVNTCSGGEVIATGPFSGGLVGSLHFAGLVAKSYSTATVSGTSAVGGLVGGNTDSGTGQHDVFRRGSVTGTLTAVGPIIGAVAATNDVVEAYFDSAAPCTGCDSIAGVGIDTTVTPSYFFDALSPPLSGWDLANVWLADGATHPVLR